MVRLTEACVKATRLPVTVKTRLGWDDATRNIEEVLGEFEKIKPGEEATFYAVVENLNSNELQFDWSLSKDDIIEYKIPMQTEDAGRRISFKVPAGVSSDTNQFG